MPVDQTSLSKLRAWWFHKQGLDHSLRDQQAAAILARTGWARSVGGCGPYLALRARAGLGRQAVDDAVASLAIHELPSARGCTYVLPAAHYALALTVAASFNGAEMKVASKLGVTEAEVETLCSAVKQALINGPLSPDELRGKVGDAARSLGPEGVKKGLSTTLPLALGELQVRGDIRRVPVNGRLDQQRYKYTLWKPNPLHQKLPLEQAYVDLARLYFRWIGPALPSEFQWFSGLGVKAAKAAMEPLGLVPVEGDRLLHADEADAYRDFKVPTEPQYAIVSSLDAISALRRELKTLVDSADMARRAVGGDGVTDMLSNGILDRGRVVGLWEFDPAKPELVYCSFVGKSPAMEEAVREAEQYVINDLGDARTFSLDSPKSRMAKIEALKKERN